MENVTIFENDNVKRLVSSNYNYHFEKDTGKFLRWGKTHNDDPKTGLAEIADIEITTICHGVNNVPCPFCYKGNTGNKGTYMSLDTFKKLFHKLPKSITQIAFGVDAHCKTNPDWYDIFKYCRDNKYMFVVPNVTVADVDDDTAKKLASVCGAVAVSRYSDPDVCYNTVKRLTDLGMTQINIHILVADETYDTIMQTFHDIKTDPRLAKLNAIVLLSLKKKGRGTSYTRLSNDKFTKLVKYAMANDISLGADSCSAFKVMKGLKDRPDYEQVKKSIEPCCATRFSSYFDVNGFYYPCSFAEGMSGWETGIDVINCNDFNSQVWFSKRTNDTRDSMMACNRACLYYDI